MAPLSFSEPLAIIGIACCFPQDATNPNNLWQCLLAGRCTAAQIPKEKCNIEGLYHPDPDRGGTVYTTTGHYLADSLAPFDAPFFSLSKTDVMSMDPQQRLVLENVFHAFENGGLSMEKVAASPTSVFVAGGFMQDFLYNLNQDPEMILRNKATGTSTTVLANRVSWFFNLTGTSLTLDTACSSSLVALHQACQTIRSGESHMAVVSGINIIDYPGTTMSLGGLGVLSPDGKCFSFDHRANGYGRGEGVGTVIVKPFSAALRDGNTIRAVLRATGSNQDGRTPGLTLPSISAQESLIRQVYASADLDMRQTSYVEAHGTGTPVGDPIEAGAIAAAFESGARKQPLYIGSIKANIGHLEAAAGMAGLIKAVLMLEKGVIPPSANFEKANPRIPLEKWNLGIAASPLPWPTKGVRRISINSFGFGGTNAHVVLDDTVSFLREYESNNAIGRMMRDTGFDDHDGAPIPNSYALHQLQEAVLRPPESFDHLSNGKEICPSSSSSSLLESDEATSIENGEEISPQCQNGDSSSHKQLRIFLFSSSDEGGIQRNVSRLLKHLNFQADVSISPRIDSHYLDDLAYTLALKRSMLDWKAFCIAGTPTDLTLALQEHVSKPVRKARHPPALGFVFTGQGAQWPGMGSALCVYQVYQKSIEEASDYMKLLGSPWTLTDELSMSEGSFDMNDPFLSQAACTAVQVALVDLLASWNILPARVVGHSSGEIAAAYCAGLISRTDAWKLAYFRGYVSATQLDRKGAMIAVGMPPERMQSFLQKQRGLHNIGGEAVIACFNSPKNVTVSGDGAIIDQLYTSLKMDKIFARKLAIKNAYHSYHMESVAETYLTLIGNLSQEGNSDTFTKVQMFSSVTAQPIKHAEAGNAEYWIKNLIAPVRFSEALLAMSSGPRSSNSRKLRVGIGSESSTIEDIVEIGPHSALRSAIRDNFVTSKGLAKIEYHNVMNRNDLTTTAVLSASAALYCRNYPVAIQAIQSQVTQRCARPPKMLVELPPYDFNHTTTFWKESRLSRNYRQRKFPRHDLFGAPVADWNPAEPRWRGFLRVSELPWLRDHNITGTIIFPGVGYVVMAIEASNQVAEPEKIINGFRLKEVSFKAAMTIPDTADGIEYILSMRQAVETSLDSSLSWRDFRIFSYDNDSQEWTEHCTGTISIEYKVATGVVDGGREAAAERVAAADMLGVSQAICQEDMGSKVTYDNWADIGLYFGPTFRNVSNIKIGNGQGHATSTVTVPNVAGCMPKAFLHPHYMQPATMDSILQTFMMAIIDLKKEEALPHPELPTFMREVWLSTAVSNAPGYKFSCAAQAEQISPTQYETSVTAWDPETNETRVTISGLKTRPLHTDSSEMLGVTRQLYHYVELQPDVNLLPKGSSIFESMIKPSKDVTEGHLATLIKRCQLLSLYFIKRSLEEIGASESARFQTHHQKYFQWMQLQTVKLSDGSLLGHDSTSLDQVLQNEDMRSAFLTNTANISAREELLLRVGPQIPRILRGEVDPLEIMFSGDDLMDRFYTELSAPGNIPMLLRAYTTALGHKSTNLKVIEIGAGTGSTTATILEALSPAPLDDCETSLSRIARYTYTDISAAFFDQARRKFNDFGNIMEFKVLDIESSPADQGFEEGEYDLLIASNVFHATSDLANTLANARSLLKRGGKLLLVESVQPDFLLSSTCFGLLPGWWLSSEDYRAMGPLLSETRWDTVLKENSFSGADVVLKDAEDEDVHEISVFVSTSIGAIADGHPSPPKVFIICASQEQKEEGLVLALQKSFRERSQDCTVIDYHYLLDFDLQDTLCVVLLGLGNTNLSAINYDEFQSIKHLLSISNRLLWISGDETENPELAMATGLIRSVRWERDFDAPNLAILSIESPSPGLEVLLGRILELCGCHLRSGAVVETNGEFLLRYGHIWVSRVRESARMTRYMDTKAKKVTHSLKKLGTLNDRVLKLHTTSPGMLTALAFEQDDLWTTPLGHTNVEMKIKAAALNFKDVMIAVGQVAGLRLGFEAMGVVTKVGRDVQRVAIGDRVFTFAARKEDGCFQTLARVPEAATVKIPASMSDDEAVALPGVFLTVLLALQEVAHLSEGETVLIHAAAGGVGQAAIQVAQAAGAEVFATVSTVEKRVLLTREYGIAEDHIFSSRDLSFVSGIKRMTKSRGVDVVLNSLSGAALHSSTQCVAPFGRFIEMGKKDIAANGKLNMSMFLNNVLFYAVDAKALMEVNTKKAAGLVEEAFDLWVQGRIHAPRPLTVYSYERVEEAFRTLQSGQGAGKIILKPRDDDVIKVLPFRPSPLEFSDNASYLLAGGLGGLGRSLAQWMHSRGAKNLIFLSRSGAQSREAQNLIEQLEKGSCRAKVCVCDVSDKAQLEAAIAECKESMPPIRGCIQGSMVLKDSMFVNMTHDNFQAALAPKVSGSRNLHEILQTELDFYVLLSSITSIVGNRGQANYAAGNAYQDALAKHLVSKGQRVVSINLGTIKTVGYIAENLERVQKAGELFTQWDGISETELHSIIEYHIDPRTDFASTGRHQTVAGLMTASALTAKGVPLPAFMNYPLFTQLHTSGTTTSSASVEKSFPIRRLLGSCASTDAAITYIMEAIQHKISSMISIAVEEIDTNKPLIAYGVDSLVAVEIRTWVANDMGADIPVLGILGNTSIADLSSRVAGRSSLVKVSGTKD